MPDQKKKKKTLKRVLKWVLALVAVALAGLIVWIYLVPMITSNAVTVYDSYTAETGDINTEKSFSATLSVKKSETFNTSEECTVKALYVSSGDEVKKGDALILLSTGDLFTASFDGVVNEIRVAVGDWVWPRFDLVQICDLEHLEVSMNVDEYDVEELSVGQACTVSIISLGVDFDTQLTHINRVSQSSNNVAFYSVTCDLTVPENILPGMQATVTIPSTSVKGVTTLDMAALSFDEDQNPYVLLRDDAGQYQKNAVKTGLSDGMKVEIQSGLTPGQTVYVVSGTEGVQSAITLDGLYRMLVGETVVVNDMSSRGARGEMPQAGANGPLQGQTGAQSTSGQAATGAITTTDPAAATDASATTDPASATTDTASATTDPASAKDTTVATGSSVTTGTDSRPQPPSGSQPPQAGETAVVTTATATPTVTPTATTTQQGGTTNVN